MIFTGIVILMILAAVAFVALPLWKRPDPAHEAGKIALRKHNHALKQLEHRLKRGELDTEAYLKSRRELEDAFQMQLAQKDVATAYDPPAKPRRGTAILVAVLVPLMAVGVYLAVGNWRAATGKTQMVAQQSVNQMVEGLAQRLNTTDGNDAKGWTMLGRSYIVMGRYADAVPAYARAYALTGDTDPDLLADYAEAIILTNPDNPGKKAATLLEKSLTIEPNNPKALWYSGLLEQKQNHVALAIQHWRKILAQNPSPAIRKMVEQRITSAGGKVNVQTSVPAKARYVIPVHVAIAAQLANKVPSGATMFVFVRPTGDSNGPPLLAKRLQVQTLPADLKLTTADAMMPGLSLAGYKQLEVTARLSLQGKPVAEPGDMEGGTVFKFATRPHPANIIINHVLP